MASAFGFSAGDFIAGVSCVQDLIKALHDCKSSSKEYLELISELRSLEPALREVAALEPKVSQYAQRVALLQAAAQCRKNVDNFLQGLASYQSHLRLGGSGYLLKDAFRKIQWRLCEKEKIVQFRAEINSHVQVIQVLLAAIQM